MANQPDVNNVQRAIRVPRELDAKVMKRFHCGNATVKDSYIIALEFATHGVELEPKDYIRIAKEIKAAKERRRP